VASETPDDERADNGDGGDAMRRNPFAARSEDEERELRRVAMRRAAIWGLGTGLSMAIVLVLCVLLLYLASTRG
jgi:hypothetical protein